MTVIRRPERRYSFRLRPPDSGWRRSDTGLEQGRLVSQSETGVRLSLATAVVYSIGSAGVDESSRSVRFRDPLKEAKRWRS